MLSGLQTLPWKIVSRLGALVAYASDEIVGGVEVSRIFS